MRFTWISVALAVVLAVPTVPAAAETNRATLTAPSDYDLLSRLNAERHEAYRTRDRQALERLFAADFVATRANGATQSRAALIAAMTSPIREIRRVTWDNLQIEVQGNTAFVSGRNYIEGTSDGRDISSVNQYTDVYVRRGGEWKMTASRMARGTATLLSFVPVSPAAPSSVELASR